MPVATLPALLLLLLAGTHPALAEASARQSPEERQGNASAEASARQGPSHAHGQASEGLAAPGDYASAREASGTSWQPDSAPMEGLHFTGRSFQFMLHGFFTLGYQDEPEPRGVSESFTTSMFMLSTRRPLGAGTLGFRVMASGEPVMGSTGYPCSSRRARRATARRRSSTASIPTT